MKRLNRKGFTLVELLAVIVILAIVVGITLVTVLPTLNETRVEAFQITAETAAEYIEKQYQLYELKPNDSTINTALKTDFAKTPIKGDFNDDLYTAAGLKAGNYQAETGTWEIINGRACVRLTRNATAGDYSNIPEDKKTATSAACGS